MDVADAGATALEDVAIESVGEWAGTARNFGEGVHNELFDANGEIRELYKCAACELYRSSLLRNDISGLLVALCRIAATQWFLRMSFNKYGTA